MIYLKAFLVYLAFFFFTIVHAIKTEGERRSINITGKKANLRKIQDLKTYRHISIYVCIYTYAYVCIYVCAVCWDLFINVFIAWK